MLGLYDLAIGLIILVMYSKKTKEGQLELDTERLSITKSRIYTFLFYIFVTDYKSTSYYSVISHFSFQ